MIYGYARVSTDGQSVDAQVRQLTKAGCAKVFRETASGAQIDRAHLRRALTQLAADDVLMATRLDRLGPLDPRPVEQPRRDHGPKGRIPLAGRRMGGHHDRTRAAHADRAGWPRR